MVFLPVVAETTYMPVFSYLHGTLTRDMDAPSYLTGLESVIGWIMAMDGYISVLPDYLGMGDGPGIHPYSHADTEASATVDALKAAGQFCMMSGVLAKPDGRLYLSGYSQGAHAALATQRELQNHPVSGLSLMKTVAGSGAYSLSYIQKNFLFDQPEYPNPSFLPYLILGYQEMYGDLYTSLNKVFVPPYRNTIPDLFNGSLTVEEIDSQLPSQWMTMFIPKYLWDIRYRYFHPVNMALRDNDLTDWKPESDLHLYYCTCDELVAKENSMLAYLSFLLRGSSKVSCLPVGPFTHFECAPFVLMLAKIQFDCASGINPCILSLPGLTKSAPLPELTQFDAAIGGAPSPDQNELMKISELAAYFDVQKLSVGSIKVWPNPARDVIQVSVPDDGINTRILEIYDVSGKMVIQKNITRWPAEIEVSPLKSGIYQVVVNGNSTLTGTVVVQD